MKTKCAVVATLISLVFASQASAVLRPLFPIKPSAPFNGELIVIGDELVLRSAKASDASTRSGTLGSAWTRAIASFILDIAWQRVYERSCQVAPHVPRGARRD